MKIAIICDKSRFSAILQRIGVWLGAKMDCPEYPYHAAFWDEETDTYYDMHVQFRKAPPGSWHSKQKYVFDCPVPISSEYLEKHVGKHLYGVLDVMLYLPAKWFKLNLPGDHCSEVVNDFLRDNGANTPWSFYDAAPSPCELLKWAAANLQPSTMEP